MDTAEALQRGPLCQPTPIRDNMRPILVGLFVDIAEKPLDFLNEIAKRFGLGIRRRELAGGRLKESRGSNCSALRRNFNLPSTLRCNVSLILRIATAGFEVFWGEKGNWRFH